ncbi:unnamed protein product [Ectocarpus sp. CCAP 1310/34]|nr:unnamed protein product [Ectocarpus sp. CCAP 1310/34]
MVERRRARSSSSSDRRDDDEEEEEEEEEEEDFDLPKDLGIRTWTKALTKEERAKRMTGLKSKTAILSVQCVLAARRPVPVVVYTAKPVQ